jgi:hypothetical protein
MPVPGIDRHLGKLLDIMAGAPEPRRRRIGPGASTA